MANPFIHIELHTPDLPKAKEFYTQLFDWKLEDVPVDNHTYTLIKVGDGTGGGMMVNQTPGVPAHWLSYVHVDDIVAYTEKAKSLGAKICQDVMQVGDVGSLSVITDPTGATFALWEPKTPMPNQA